jgi:phytanoyl-CoA hydroxylase
MIDANEYRKSGFVLCRGFFTTDEVAQIQDDAMRIFAVQMTRLGIVSSPEVRGLEFEEGMFKLFESDLSRFTNCGKQAQHLISLHRLSLDPRLVQALNELGLDFANISTRPLLYFNHPRLAKKEVYWRLGLHQDWRSMQGSLDSCVVWVALTEIGRDLGALEIIPGSHLAGLADAEMTDGYGLIDASSVDESSLVAVEVERGDALFFSSFLLHRSGTNVTDSIRWSCHFRYNNLSEKTFVARGFPHPYLYQPQAELITEGFPTRQQVEASFVSARSLSGTSSE